MRDWRDAILSNATVVIQRSESRIQSCSIIYAILMRHGKNYINTLSHLISHFHTSLPLTPVAESRADLFLNLMEQCGTLGEILLGTFLPSKGSQWHYEERIEALDSGMGLRNLLLHHQTRPMGSLLL